MAVWLTKENCPDGAFMDNVQPRTRKNAQTIGTEAKQARLADFAHHCQKLAFFAASYRAHRAVRLALGIEPQRREEFVRDNFETLERQWYRALSAESVA